MGAPLPRGVGDTLAFPRRLQDGGGQQPAPTKYVLLGDQVVRCWTGRGEAVDVHKAARVIGLWRVLIIGLSGRARHRELDPVDAFDEAQERVERAGIEIDLLIACALWCTQLDLPAVIGRVQTVTQIFFSHRLVPFVSSC